VATTGKIVRAVREVPWFLVTLVVHLALYAVPATVAWRDSLNATGYVPLVGLAVTLTIGVALLFARTTRS